MEVKAGSERNFGIVFATVFLIIALYPLLHDRPIAFWSLAVAAVFLIVALVRPRLLKPLNVAWFKFGMLLAKIIQPVVMAAVFYLVVTPTGIIMRALGKDLLNRKLDTGKQSYWQNRDQASDRVGSMKDQF